MQLTNGLNVSVSQALAGTDEKGNGLKFKQDGQSIFTAKGKDGKVYSFDVGSTLVRVDVGDRPNYKQLRKEGRPVPKDKAKEADEQIKKEKEREEKVAKGEMSPEDAAKEAKKDQEKEQKELEKEVEEEETEEEKKTEPAGLKAGQRSR
jgi:hypothetical protein